MTLTSTFIAVVLKVLNLADTNRELPLRLLLLSTNAGSILGLPIRRGPQFLNNLLVVLKAIPQLVELVETFRASGSS